MAPFEMTPGRVGAMEIQAVSKPAAGVAAVAAKHCASGPQALCVMAAWRETVRLKREEPYEARVSRPVL